MDTTDVVRELLRSGHLISPEAAELVARRPEPTNVKTASLVVKAADLKPLSVVWEHKAVAEQINITDATLLYAQRHTFYRTLLEPKADRRLLVSAAKATVLGSTVSIIGLVREVYDTYVVVEDGTGSIRVRTKERLLEDECILVTGTLERDGVKAEAIVFPDIPIDRGARTSSIEKPLVFSFDVPDGLVDSIVIVTDSAAGKEQIESLAQRNTVVWLDGQGVTAVRTPALLDVLGLRVFVYRTSTKHIMDATGAESPEKAAVRLLRARHLDPVRRLSGDPLLLQEVPDIVCMATERSFSTNYKGVSVVSPAPDRSYKINSHTRVIE